MRSVDLLWLLLCRKILMTLDFLSPFPLFSRSLTKQNYDSIWEIPTRVMSKLWHYCWIFRKELQKAGVSEQTEVYEFLTWSFFMPYLHKCSLVLAEQKSLCLHYHQWEFQCSGSFTFFIKILKKGIKHTEPFKKHAQIKEKLEMDYSFKKQDVVRKKGTLLYIGFYFALL